MSSRPAIAIVAASSRRVSSLITPSACRQIPPVTRVTVPLRHCSSPSGAALTRETPAAMTDRAQDAFSRALASNHAWAAKTCESQPTFFTTSAKGQTPSILWLGCADSRIPESTILDLPPGNVFVHRNIANILTDSDLSSLSVIEFAVRYLKVEHAVVCGHTSCGGVAAALGNDTLGVLDHWIQPLRRLRLAHAAELRGLHGDARTKRLAELNVLQSLNTLKGNATVIEAMRTRGLRLHGVIYDLASGKLEVVQDPETEDAAKARAECFDTLCA